LLDTDSLKAKALDIYFKRSGIGRYKATIESSNIFINMMIEFHMSVLDSVKFIEKYQQGSLANITIGCNVCTHRGDYGEVIEWRSDLLYKVIHPNGIISLYNEEDLTVVTKGEYIGALKK
jgi:hypothetical protein